MRKYFNLFFSLLFFHLTDIGINFEADDCSAHNFRILTNFDNENYKMNVLSKEDEIKNFGEAQRACQLCFNGFLLVGNETKDIPSTYLNWIGLYRAAHSSTWTWSNGEPLDDWKLYAQEFRHKFLQPKYAYSVLAYRKQEKIVWLAINNEKFQTNGRLAAMMDNIAPREYYGTVVSMSLAATCRTLLQNNCHYWNYTEHGCVYDEAHGCHGYASTMVQTPDNSSVHCPLPAIERFAFPCNITQCLQCRVGEWSEWSACSAKLCRDGEGVKIRSRKLVAKTCPEEKFYVSLKQIRHCTIAGCDLLRNLTALDEN